MQRIRVGETLVVEIRDEGEYPCLTVGRNRGGLVRIEPQEIRDLIDTLAEAAAMLTGDTPQQTQGDIDSPDTPESSQEQEQGSDPLLRALDHHIDLLYDIVRSLTTKLRIANQALALHTVKPAERGRTGWRCHLCGQVALKQADIEHAENCPLRGYKEEVQ